MAEVLTHGKYTTYKNHGCRCDECRAAQRERSRLEYQANRERKLEYQRRYIAENKEAVRARHFRYAEKNREAKRQYARQWRQQNPDKVIEYNRNADKATKLLHNKMRRARQRSATVVYFTDAQLQARWLYYGNRCWMCGDIATQTDHVKPLSKGGAHMLSNLRPACGPCNTSKKDRWPL